MAVNIGKASVGRLYKGNSQIARVYKGSTLVYSSELTVVGTGAENTAFLAGGFGTWNGGWISSCNTQGIQFCGGDGGQSSGGQSNNYLPDGYSRIKIDWSVWSDTAGYSRGLDLVGSDGSQIAVVSGTVYSLKKGVNYKVRFSARHTYSRTVNVTIASIVLGD